MGIYNLYDSFYAENPSPSVLGGKNRARQARRDRFGRFLPADGELPAPEKHGRDGGLKRSSLARRDHRGRFASNGGQTE